MIVAGFGCSSQAATASLHDVFVRMACVAKPDALACLDGRAAWLAPFARQVGLPLITLKPAQIQGIATPTQSARIQVAFGTGSVAEACALVVAAGSLHKEDDRRAAAVIAVARLISQDGQATGAVARGGGI